jgi:NOL1/NOP2/fmu family ribosome biogenesis protein
MGLSAADAAAPLDLDPEGPQALAYLRGESLAAPGPKGWTLVAVDGFALGWGKRVGETVKNHYPKGLRWRQGVG